MRRTISGMRINEFIRILKRRKKMASSDDMSRSIGRMASKKGMGFKAAAPSVQKKEGVSAESANKIIAAGARNASPAAKKANKNLKKVKGGY